MYEFILAVSVLILLRVFVTRRLQEWWYKTGHSVALCDNHFLEFFYTIEYITYPEYFLVEDYTVEELETIKALVVEYENIHNRLKRSYKNPRIFIETNKGVKLLSTEDVLKQVIEFQEDYISNLINKEILSNDEL